jgi:hypothetical protein
MVPPSRPSVTATNDRHPSTGGTPRRRCRPAHRRVRRPLRPRGPRPPPARQRAQGWWLARTQQPGTGDTEPAGRPFALVPAVILAAIISVVLPTDSVSRMLSSTVAAAVVERAHATVAVVPVPSPA